jgi:HK97 gp10 family phage protein
VRTRIDMPIDFERQVASKPETGRVLGDRAEDVAAAIRAVAPVRTGAYRDSIRAQGSKRESDGYVGLVEIDSPYWHYVEFGTEDTPTFSPIRRALHRLGLKSNI